MKLSELDKLKDTTRILDNNSGEILTAKELKDMVSSMKRNDYTFAQIQDFLSEYRIFNLS